MNIEMAYLLGMISGNGEIQRTPTNTIVSIDIPHKKLQTDEIHDVMLYVKASIADIRVIVEPLVGTGLNFIQNPSSTVLSFTKLNTDYLIREINRFTGNAVSHNDIVMHEDIFS